MEYKFRKGEMGVRSDSSTGGGGKGEYRMKSAVERTTKVQNDICEQAVSGSISI